MSWGCIRLFCVSAGLCVLTWGAIGQEPVPSEGGGKRSEAAVPPDYVRHWYFAFGSSNFHPRLEESEAKIDRQVNDLVGWLPPWKNPITFKDWADDFKLWDVTFGVGRDFTPRTSWMIWTGGATAHIENHERYGPLTTDIGFKRFTAFLTVQGYCYPWGKVDHETVTGEQGFKRAKATLANTKPYFSLATGYVYMHADADGRFNLPLVGTILRQTDEYDHHLFHVSPRVGVELPLSKNNSLTMEGLYYFFGPEHGDEYNGPSVNFMFKHRF